MGDPAAVVGAFNQADRAWWALHADDPEALSRLFADPELMSVHRAMAVCRLRCSRTDHPMHRQVGRSVEGTRAAVADHLARIGGSGLSRVGCERAARRLLAALQGILVLGALPAESVGPTRLVSQLLAIVGEPSDPVDASSAPRIEVAMPGANPDPTPDQRAAVQQLAAAMAGGMAPRIASAADAARALGADLSSVFVDDDDFDRAVLEANVRFAFGGFEGDVEESLARVHEYFEQVDILRGRAGDLMTISFQTVARAVELPDGEPLRGFTLGQVLAAHADLAALLDLLDDRGWLRSPTSVSAEAFVLLAMVLGLCIDSMYVDESRGIADELDAHLRLLAHWS